ncbi:LysR family transcriptional regulator [Saccharopolyspora phatthalungensis]|uniref:DNA-binding transcriptional LysR family regulator n=1 Tax=Saccharopolyspora phatthalungensis TaxID=664693 RepID=A0A840Q395_9PSEU|nr:LysR family transcriptional regulator [Saccharopolyspora phatthalungensis]MBB5153218.1 DNA-binding transcriptional LysR family regulator [Saccharopolyspora phatthalungensis]
MPLAGTASLPATDPRSRLLRSPAALLETTLDQLRTLILVHEVGTALAAARSLGREQSSVQKQLDTLNRNFQQLCGEPLVIKQGRGKKVLFTASGESFVAIARETLGDWLDGVHESRRLRGETVTVGTTRFTLGFLANAGEHVAAEFQERGIDLRVTHLRTRELLDALRTKQADLVCGSVLITADDAAALAEFEVMEWRRSGLSLVTNLSRGRLPNRVMRASELHGVPLVVPASGLISGFLHGWFGTDFREKLDIAAEIDDVRYGFDLLRSELLHGCMIVTQGVGEAAGDGRLPEGQGLRTIELVNDVGPKMQVLVGAFTRRGERQSYYAEHPLNLLWTALELENAKWKRGEAANAKMS